MWSMLSSLKSLDPTCFMRYTVTSGHDAPSNADASALFMCPYSSRILFIKRAVILCVGCAFVRLFRSLFFCLPASDRSLTSL